MKFKRNKIIATLIVLLILTLVFFVIKILSEQIATKDYQKRLKEAPVGTFVKTGDMNLPRAGHSAIKLKDGKILIVGGNKGAEIFDPKTGQFKLINKKLEPFDGNKNNSLLLENGNVLVANKYLFDVKTYQFKKIDNYDSYLKSFRIRKETTCFSNSFILSNRRILIIYRYPVAEKKVLFFLYDFKSNKLKEQNITVPSKYFLPPFDMSLVKGKKILIWTRDYLQSAVKKNTEFILWDYTKNSFKKIGSPIVKRLEGKMLLLSDNKVLIIGHDTDGIIELLDLESNKIKIIGKTKYPRTISPSITPIESFKKFFIIGGDVPICSLYGKICPENYYSKGKMMSEVYDISNNKSTQSIELERRFHPPMGSNEPQFTVTKLDDKNILITGGAISGPKTAMRTALIYKIGE